MQQSAIQVMTMVAETGTAISSREEDNALNSVDIVSLTRSLAQGNEQACRELHSRYFDRLLRYLLVITRGDEQAARDALQETFTRIVRHARRFENETAFWNWMAVIARTSHIDLCRKQNRYLRLLSRYASQWFFKPAVPESGPDHPENLMEEYLSAGLSQLEKTDRALLEGKYFGSLTVRELALQFQLTEKAVESRLGRARQQLRSYLLEKLRHE